MGQQGTALNYYTPHSRHTYRILFKFNEIAMSLKQIINPIFYFF